MEENSKGMMSFLLGIAVGVAIGFWWATDNKEEIVDRLLNTAEKVKDGIEEEIEKGKKAVGDLKNKVSDLLDKA